VKKILGVALGITAALGGFLDIGELVFNTQAGARFGYSVLWAIPVGVLGIMVYTEMAGRVAAVARQATFDLIRDRYGPRLGILTLFGSLLLNLLTLAAEIGGVGLALQLFFDGSPQLFMLIAVLVLALAAWLLPFEGLERIFGYGGLGLLVYLAVSHHAGPNWSAIGSGFVPQVQPSTLYWYSVVGVIAAAFMPYEVYFYSSGGIEEGWTPRDMGVNRANAIVGFGLGGVLSAALIVVGAQYLQPNGVDPDSLGAVVLSAMRAFGQAGVVLALVGIVFAVGGAAIETSLSAAYNLAQYMRWPWGKRRSALAAPRWHASWALLFLAGYALVATGVDPIQLTEYAVLLSAVVLPLTYLPLLRAARDPELMGEYVNGRLANVLGSIYLVVICVVAVAAPVLIVATRGGSG
jgi:manganese transport protein